MRVYSKEPALPPLLVQERAREKDADGSTDTGHLRGEARQGRNRGRAHLHDEVVNNTVEYPQGSSFNQPIGNWDTREVTTMRSERQARPCLIPDPSDAPCARSRADMFHSADSFDQPLSFNTSKVTGTGMERMFHSAKAFNSPLIGWDTSHVTSFSK